MRRSAGLIVFAIILISLSFFVRYQWKDVARPPQNKDAHAEGRNLPRATPESLDPGARPPSDVPATLSPTEKREAVKNQMTPVQPDLRLTPSMQRILADSNSAANAMFQRGLEAVNQGDFSTARRIFQEILSDYGWDCNQNKLAPAAYWSIGLSYYQEGGDAGLQTAGTFFQSFLQTYPNCEPKELAQAAQINTAVVYMERMRLADKEAARERAAQSAVTALKAFLEKWPDSPQAYAASLSLGELQSYVAKAP